MSAKPKFSLGDKVWIASGGNFAESWVQCPHCFGKGFLTVIMGDDSQVTIGCSCCHEAFGYSCCHEAFGGSRGQIKEYGFKASCYEATVETVSFENGQFKYNHNEETDVFATKEEAEARSEQFRAAHEESERNRIFHKKDQKRTWAWNASYHRKELKRAQHDVIYHTAALDVTKSKAKQPEPKTV